MDFCLLIILYICIQTETTKTMIFEIAISLFTSLLEKAVEKRESKGKNNKFLKKAFSEETQEKVAKAYQAYAMIAIELEDELEPEA